MQNLAKVQNGRPALPMRQDAHADGAKRPEVEKLIIVYDVGFFHQLGENGGNRNTFCFGNSGTETM